MDYNRPGSPAHGILGFLRRAYWSRSPFPSWGDLLNPRIAAVSPSLTGGSLSPLPLSHHTATIWLFLEPMSSGSYFNLESWYSAREKFKKVILPLTTHFLYLTAETQKKVLTDKNWLMGRKEENSGYYSKGFYFANKWLIVKAMVFPVVMSGCESWTILQGEHWRIDAFELWCSKRLLRVPWSAKRSN